MTSIHRPLSRYSFQCFKAAKKPHNNNTTIQPSSQLRAYQSSAHPAPAPYDPASTAILSAALSHVPQHGFTSTALRLGAHDAGYLSVSTNLFPRGAFELVHYHLSTQRLALQDRVQFPDRSSSQTSAAASATQLSTTLKIRALLLARLRANVDAGVVPRWQQALALMAMPSNVGASVRELARLSDEMWFLAGDAAVDASWYSKRAALSAVYAAAEVYQTQDQSTDFKDTEMFVDARLGEVRTLGSAAAGLGEWVGFTGMSFVNVLRSKGLRI